MKAICFLGFTGSRIATSGCDMFCMEIKGAKKDRSIMKRTRSKKGDA